MVGRDGGSQDHAVSGWVSRGAESGLLICSAGAPAIHETGGATNAVSPSPALSPTAEFTPTAMPNVGERGQNLLATDLSDAHTG